MKLDELIKQADNPTPEYIKKLSKQVHELQGECWHIRHGHSTFNEDFYTYYCDKCESYQTGILNPDYTKPENFWPLIKENNIVLFYDSGYAVACNDVVRYFDVKGFYKDWHNERNYCAIRADEGEHDLEIVGCLAYLKVKENETLINELDLPDAEDILKMRGKVKEQENNGKQNA